MRLVVTGRAALVAATQCQSACGLSAHLPHTSKPLWLQGRRFKWVVTQTWRSHKKNMGNLVLKRRNCNSPDLYTALGVRCHSYYARVPNGRSRRTDAP